MTKDKKGTQLNCFSPPVMVATMIIELSLALYTVWRYKMTELTRLVALMLVGLATFQLAEYFVCTGPGPQALPWSRLGFVAITTLPPLGLHIMHVLANKPNRRLVLTAYATMAGFITYFLASQTAFTGHQCTGNYVIFQFSQKVTGTYSVYYYGWLLAGIGLGWHWANETLAKGKKAFKRLQTIRGLIIGYLVFLVPVATVNTIKPETRRGIPSIMCGFAVMLALILALYILPRAVEVKADQRARV
jgi:hypothetical protein